MPKKLESPEKAEPALVAHSVNINGHDVTVMASGPADLQEKIEKLKPLFPKP